MPAGPRFFGEMGAASVLRQARNLLKEVELFASPAELAEAKARVERFKVKQASGTSAQKTSPLPPSSTGKDNDTERK